MSEKTFGERLRDHPISITITLMAALVTVVAFLAPTDMQDMVKAGVSKCCRRCIAFLAKVDPNESKEQKLSTNEPPATLRIYSANSNGTTTTSSPSTSIMNEPKGALAPSEKVETETNYLCVIYNASRYQVSFHLNVLGKWGPGHLLEPYTDFYFNGEDSDLEIRFNPSPFLPRNSDEQLTSLYALQTTGPVTDNDWTNAPHYFFQYNGRGKIDLFDCDCN